MVTPALRDDFMGKVRSPGVNGAELMGAIAAMIGADIGTKLLTASIFDMERDQMSRVYSDNLEAYPLAGIKPIPESKWTDVVLRQHMVYAALTIEEVAEIFFDWRLIQSLGCESSANIPVVVAGKAIGAFNLLHETGYYTAERLAPVGAILPYATIAFQFLLGEHNHAIQSGAEALQRD